MRQKGGGQVPLEYFFDAPRQRGAAVGLTFHFEKITRAPNTLLSHRLIALAPEAKQPALIEAIYAAYFEHGQDIGDLETLVRIAGEQDLETGWVRTQLAGGAGQEEVLADIRWAREHGISGVPFFVLNGRYAFSGAQPPEVMLGIFERLTSGKLG